MLRSREYFNLNIIAKSKHLEMVNAQKLIWHESLSYISQEFWREIFMNLVFYYDSGHREVFVRYNALHREHDHLWIEGQHRDSYRWHGEI